jgi:hypothetical protein
MKKSTVACFVFFIFAFFVFSVPVSQGASDDKSSEAAIAVLRSHHLKQALTTDAQIRESEDYLKTLKEDRRLQLNDTPERRKLDQDIEGMELTLKDMKERTGDAGRAKAEKEFKKVLDGYRKNFERETADNSKLLKEDPELREKMWAEFLWHFAKRFKESEDSRKANVQRIEFKARVVDPDGTPIPEVKVVFVTSYSYGGPPVKFFNKTGNEKGEFEVEVEGYDYIKLDRILVPKGYRYDVDQQRRRMFECIKHPGEDRPDKRFPDDGYVKFVLVKDFQRTEKVIKSRCIIDNQAWREKDGVYEGPQKVAYACDLLKMRMTSQEASILANSHKQLSPWEEGHYNVTKLNIHGDEMPDPKETQGKGDFVVQVFRSPSDRGVGVLRVTAIDGGIVNDTRGDYLAPETGYQPFVEYTFNASKSCFSGLGSAYLKSRNNQVCSRIKITIDFSIGDKEFEDAKIGVEISAFISPTGDRILTPWGPSYTEEEQREFSKRDWKKKE